MKANLCPAPADSLNLQAQLPIVQLLSQLVQTKDPTLFPIVTVHLHSLATLKHIPTALYTLMNEMLRAFAFRTLPPLQNPRGREFDPGEDDATLVPAVHWHTLESAYNLYLTFFNGNVQSNAQFAIDHLEASRHFSLPWLHALVALLGSEDPRERRSIILILHRIYKTLLTGPHRKQIRGILYGTLIEFHQSPANCSHCHHYEGISEILTIFSCLINGFSVPLRKEHLIFFQKALVPLWKSPYLCTYWTPLLHCTQLFVKREASASSIECASFLVAYLLRMWPSAHSQHSLMFLEVLVEVLLIHINNNGALGCDLLQSKIIGKIVGDCVNNVQYQIAEKACCVLRMGPVQQWIVGNGHLQGVVEALRVAVGRHWNQGVRNAAQVALEGFLGRREG